MPRSVVVGTAGHVDHGKSSLVEALTGTHPDRLEEERERGITIDLGFAHAAEADGVILSFVDVPGHERFVKNMLAGASGMDVVLLVVAADESVMPQTREHLDVCRLLGATTGVVALTKADAADEAMVGLARLEIAELVEGTFLAGAPVIACSAVTRTGLDDLRRALLVAAQRAPTRPATGPLRLPVDRSFTLKGFGAVVTGTVMSGQVRAGDDVDVLPAGRSCRVRGVQVHGQAAERGMASQRVALNLGGVEHHDLARGDVVVTPGSHVATRVMDVVLRLLPSAPEIGEGARVRVHVGTAEVMARVRWAGDPPAPGGEAGAQLRLEGPVVAAVGDRFILRRYSPVATIGGGLVLHPAPVHRLRRRERRGPEMLRRAASLEAGASADVLALLAADAGLRGVSETALAAWAGWTVDRVREALARFESDLLARVAESPRRWLRAADLAAALDAVVERLVAFHREQPLLPGHPKQALRAETGLDEIGFAALLERGVAARRLVMVRDLVSAAGHAVTLTDAEQRARDALVDAHAAAGLTPPDLESVMSGLRVDRATGQKLLRLVQKSGDLIRLKEGMMLSGTAMAGLLGDMSSWLQPGQAFSVPEFKERSGTSRKHAIPLLEYLDAQGYTRRQGDGRVWTGRAAPGVAAKADEPAS